MSTTPLLAPFDPADSPGPITKVAERFPLNASHPRCPRCEPEPDDYTVVLADPKHVESLGFKREDVGLLLYRGCAFEAEVESLREAADLIERDLGRPVRLVERHADLTYWTAHQLE